jgi:AraC-like DNA-binding protein
MNDFFKYLAPTPEEKNWGIFITVAGYSRIFPGMPYPVGKHPSGYLFRWENGRVLNEYQLVYITEGKGVFETKDGKAEITPGTMILLYPGIWHRYKPLHDKGWVEFYIGINGEIAKRLMSHPAFRKFPAFRCGFKEDLLECYQNIFTLIKEEKPGFQMIASGEAVKMIGILISLIKYPDSDTEPYMQCIEKTKFLIRENLNQKIDFQEVASSLNIGYSNFRKIFKKFTGISPSHYHLNLRLIKAKELLIHSDKTMKEIAWETGFFSESYFSRIFREKMGQSPSGLRK